ncbi:MAG: hypothetical protein JXA30_08255 [Deltaproteobacteria bacterium]|nr:hypothetical protein [Deltaproteobacteria bacterium]
MKQPAKQSILFHQRGTASIEAVIMLPVMAVCWAGIFFFLQGFDQQLDAAVEARREAWALSNAACRSAQRQYDCGGVLGSDAASESSGWLDGLSEIPIVGWLFGSVFGYSTKVTVLREWRSAPMFGRDEKRSSYDYQIMCNEEEMTVGDLIKAVVCEQLEAVEAGLKWLGIDCPDPRHSEQCIPSN